MAGYQTSIRVGDIFGEMFAVGRRNWIALAAFTILMGVVAGVLPYLMDENTALIFEMLISSIASYALLWRVLGAERLRDSGIWGGRFLPYAGSSLVASLGMLAGFVLLVVPGVVLMARWSLVIPLVVARGQGMAAFGESWRLTRPAMWPILGFVALCGLVFVVAMFVLGFSMAFNEDALATGSLSSHVLSVVTYAISGLFSLSSVALFALLADRGGEAAEIFA